MRLTYEEKLARRDSRKIVRIDAKKYAKENGIDESSVVLGMMIMLRSQYKLMEIVEDLSANNGNNSAALVLAEMIVCSLAVCTASDPSYAEQSCDFMQNMVAMLSTAEVTPGDQFELMIQQGISNE